ncbi:MAG: HAD family hydrolase [Candidatus Magasanikbacteria bacterium]
MKNLSDTERVIFDFDNTLFDTETKKQRLYNMAQAHGYDREEARDIYKEARTRNEKIIMSLSSYMKTLKDRVNEDGKEFRSEEVSEIITEIKSGDGLLPYASEFLKHCLQEDLDTYILSLGQKDWQQEKVNQSGIEEFMPEEKIIFTNSTKKGKQNILEEVFTKDFEGENTLLINDKPDETKEILSDFPKLVSFLRYEPRDDRYKEKDFEQLQQQYPDRVLFYSQDLKKILDKFKKLYAKE